MGLKGVGKLAGFGFTLCDHDKTAQAPPFIVGPEQFDEIVDAMRVVLVDDMSNSGHE